MRRFELFLVVLMAVAILALVGPAQAGLISGVAETGTGLNPLPAYYTGQTFDHPNEGAGFTVPYLDEDVPFFNNRSHEYNGISAQKSIASLGLVGAEYVMAANENRGVADYQLSVTVGQTVNAYVMMDTRVTQPAWLTDDGWEHLGFHRMGIDENGDSVGPGEGIDNTFFLWKQADIPAGTFVTKERGGSGNNMYGLVVTESGVGPNYLAPPIVGFSYSTLAKGGSISGMLDTTPVGGTGPVLFTAAMPDPALVDPNPALTPAGAVGTVTEQQGSHNEPPLKTVGLDWAGVGPVTLTGTDGINNYSIDVDLLFGPSGDSGYNNPAEDPLSSFDALLGPEFVYEWNIEVSDDALVEHGGDAVSTGGDDNPRMAVWLAEGTEEANGGSHRFTQIERQFNQGPDAYANTDETTDSIKWSKFAAYQGLGIFYGWRDRDSLGGGSFQVDSIDLSGNLLVDTARMTSVPVPEPSTLIMLAAVALAGLLAWRRRR